MTLYKRVFVHDSYVRKSVEQTITKIKPNATVQATTETYTGIRPPNPGEIPLCSKSNQRLEFLGDGILEAVAKFWIYRQFPTATEGFMTDMKINLVKNEAIGRIAIEMGLNKWLLIEKNLETKLRNDKSKMGCLFEAFIGALFLDMNHLPVTDEEGRFDSGLFLSGPGFQVVQLFLESVFEKHVNRVKLITENTNYKRILQERIQALFKTTPIYVLESQPVRNPTATHSACLGVQQPSYETAAETVAIQDTYKMGAYLCVGGIDPHGLGRKDATNAWTAQVRIENLTQGFYFLGEGEHRVKKEAEQAACKMALESWDNKI